MLILQKFLNVYDREKHCAPARIIGITNDPDGIAVEIKYLKDGTTRCYLLSDKTDMHLPENDQPHDYFYKSKNSFDYLFITENQISRLKDKVWPIRFGDINDAYLVYRKCNQVQVFLCLFEYIEPIDANHSNYKFIWYDGSNRKNEFIVTLSREDINELLDDEEDFIKKIWIIFCPIFKGNIYISVKISHNPHYYSYKDSKSAKIEPTKVINSAKRGLIKATKPAKRGFIKLTKPHPLLAPFVVLLLVIGLPLPPW